MDFFELPYHWLLHDIREALVFISFFTAAIVILGKSHFRKRAIVRYGSSWICGTFIIGLGYLIEPTIWGLAHSWKSAEWFHFSHTPFTDWIETCLSGGMAPAAVAALAFIHFENPSKQRIYMAAAVACTLWLQDGFEYLHTFRYPGFSSSGEYTTVTRILFCASSDLLGGSLGGVLAYHLTLRFIAFQNADAATRLKSKLSAIPWKLASILGLLIWGPSAATRAASFFGLEFAPSLAFIRLSRESSLKIEVPSNNRMPSIWGEGTPVLLVPRGNSAETLSMGGNRISKEFQVRVTYPDARPLKLYAFQIFQAADVFDGKQDLQVLKCSPNLKLPITLEDSLIELQCSFSLSNDNVFRPLNDHELRAAMLELPSWGKGWVVSKGFRLIAKFRTASEQSERAIPLQLYSPTSQIQLALRQRQEVKNKIELDFASGFSKVKSRGAAAKFLGAPLATLAMGTTSPFECPETQTFRCPAFRDELNLCRWIISFDKNGKAEKGSWSSPEANALQEAVENFRRRISKIRNQGDALDKFGEPHLKIGNEWFYPLPLAPEYALFNVRFDNRQTFLTATVFIR